MLNLTKAEPFPIGQDRTLLLSLVSVEAATGLLSWLNPFYRGRFKKEKRLCDDGKLFADASGEVYHAKPGHRLRSLYA
jgi:hypothetical protein